MCKNTYNDLAKQPPAFFKAHTCVNVLDDDIIARNETKVKVYFFNYYYSFLSIDSVFSRN